MINRRHLIQKVQLK